ncbi:MAG: T9SS type A sorting domain-containing protein [Ignavibacteriaceae bacterium]|nr:T9SS type A sorting domain-containing protein [Ignavibacteriaceae bacterium]
MKKLLLFLLFSSLLYCQSQPTIFWKVGYYDNYWLYKQLYLKNQNFNLNHFINSNYYFDKMSELGLTHLVSYGDQIALNNNNTNGLKIIDDNLSQYTCHPKDLEVAFYPYFYSRATGNEKNSLPYEVGGDKADPNLEIDNWGFGADNGIRVSRYVKCEPFKLGDPNPPIINSSFEDINTTPHVHVFRADTNNNHEGIFLTADLRKCHQPYSGDQWKTLDYYINIRARIDNIPNGNPIVAKIHVYEVNESTDPFINLTISQNHISSSSVSIQGSGTDTTFDVHVSDFTGTNYTDIEKGWFEKKGDDKTYFRVEITFMNTADLLVDKFSVYDNFYKDLFVSGSSQDSSIASQLGEYFDEAIGYDNIHNHNYEHLYVDEPELLMNRSLNYVSGIATNRLGKYVNGCNLCYSKPDYETENYLRRPPYASMDSYPFKAWTGTSTSEVQTALDGLIDNPYSHSGFRTTINWAQNFNNNSSANLTDDIPYYQVIQVAATKSATPSYFDLRPPSEVEILVQGNLALCYGAKGIMYYQISTLANYNIQYWAKQWGLFDDPTHAFTGDTSNTQNIENAVVPNSRYYAVKELNASIDKISSELLQLTWVNGASLHKEDIPPEGSYITSTYSYDTDPYEPDPDNYVELGLFKKTTAYTDVNLEYFMVVNRLCSPNDPPTKYIITTLSKPNSSYLNWGLNEIGTANRWTGIKGCGINLEYAMGTGKLFKFAPVVLYGGDIRYNETITGTNTLSGEMSIKSGDTLTISANSTYNINNNISIESGGTLILNPGATLNINNGASLVVNGNLVIKNNAVLNIPNGDSITVYGHIICETDLTIPNGRILKLQPGATLDMDGDNTLEIEGTLSAIGTSSNLISFNTGAIIFSDTSAAGSSLNYCSLNYLTGFQCLDNADITISNCIFQHPGDVIYVYNASPKIMYNQIYESYYSGILCQLGGSWENEMLIWYNTIIKTSLGDSYHLYQGIWIYDCDAPVLGTNQISGYYNGMAFGGGSCAFLASDSLYKNNLITGNLVGILINNSTLFAGSESGDFCGYNSIHDNYYNIYAVGSWIEAGYNYWGDSHRSYSDGESEIYFYGDLNYDPWANGNKAITLPPKNTYSSTHLNKSLGTDSSSINNPYTGLLLEKQNRITDAINYYESLIQQNKHVQFAVKELAKIRAKYSRNEISGYFDGLLTDNKYYSVVEKLIGDTYLKNNQVDDAITAYNNVIKNNASENDVINAKFEKLFAYLHIKKDPVTASQILSDIKVMNSKDTDVQMRIDLAERLINAKNKTVQKSSYLTKEVIPKSYNLSQNYPNPFNPSTIISYSLPKPAVVTLKVYDILGREVATLVNENKIEGTYNITFDASRFASGVYIYQLRANNFVSSKKMVVVK